MRTQALSLVLLLGAALAADAPPGVTVDYEVIADHEARTWRVRVELPSPLPGDVDFWIPRWTPGAYHLADYGRFVWELAARDGAGAELAVERLADCHWRIEAGDAERIAIEYTARSMSRVGFANQIIDVEANRIARDYGYLSPASLLGYVPALIDAPVRLSLQVPAGWQVATALERQEDDSRFVAPSYYRLEDSPLFFSATQRTLEFEAGGKPHFVTVYGVDDAKAAGLAQICRRIVDATLELMQELPYERYHFLIGLVPEAMGAGLEHADSTLILSNPALPDDGLIGMISHEYVHAWVAERLNVEAIHRPDFTTQLETSTIWFNEGVTEYMSRHVLLRAGLMDRDEFMASFLGDATQVAAMRSMLGRKPWTEISREAGADGGMRELMEFSLICYQVGPGIILALDLEMRRVSGGERGVIDWLRLMNRLFIARDRGFEEDELIPLASGVAQADLSSFYESHIDGTEDVDLERALAVIGYGMTARSRRQIVAREELGEELPDEVMRAREDFFGLPPAVKEE